MRTPPRILVVDDNPTNIKIVQTRLASEGYEIVTAADGEEALVAAHDQLPDLILLDVMMPRLDGIEVCKRLRADPAFPFTPIVLVTAMTDTKEVVAGLDAGADEYLTKPVDHRALVARVRSMLRIKALHDRAGSPGHGSQPVERVARAARRGAGRGARARRQAAPVLLAAARRGDPQRRRRGSAAEPSARDHGGVLRPARLHRVRRDLGARGSDGRAARIPRRDRRADPRVRRHARALHRRRHDDLLQRPGARARCLRARCAHGAGDARPHRAR